MMQNEDSIQLGPLEQKINQLMQFIENLKIENSSLKRQLLDYEHDKRQLKTKK